MSAMSSKTIDLQADSNKFFKNYGALSNIHLMNTPFSTYQVMMNGQINATNLAAKKAAIAIDSNTDPNYVQVGDRAMQGNIEGVVTAKVEDGTKLTAVRVTSISPYLGGTVAEYEGYRLRKFLYVLTEETVAPAAGETVVRADALQHNGSSLMITPLNR